MLWCECNLRSLNIDFGQRLRIVRREQSARSRQHRGVLTEVIYECAVLEVRRTEMETGSTCGSLEFGGSSAVHFVIGGTPCSGRRIGPRI
jgi:hypothetical protein